MLTVERERNYSVCGQSSESSNVTTGGTNNIHSITKG